MSTPESKGSPGFDLETNSSWSSEFFWPQTTTSSDDICICCGNLRVQGHKLDCRLAKVADLHDRVAALLHMFKVARDEGWYEDNPGWAEIDRRLSALLRELP